MNEPSESGTLAVDEGRCIRCGACALTAPGLFEMTPSGSRARRQPEDAREARAARGAQLMCPTVAITLKGRPSATSSIPQTTTAAPLYPRLARQSEEVRWQVGAIGWERLDPDLAVAPLRTLVREMAFSEHATYSATQRFMQAFGDEVDFTQWLSIWFYEETRHPQTLMQWLRAVGEPVDDAFVLHGRVSTPFMRSKMGTLVTNVISEVTAATAYSAMARSGHEPVLSQIARFIAGDEARHASAFFQFALARLDGATDRHRERLDALKVLHFWLNETEQVSHPINQMLERVSAAPTEGNALRLVAFDFASVRRRITRLVALLAEVELSAPEDVLPALKALTEDVHTRHRDTDTAEAPSRTGG